MIPCTGDTLQDLQEGIAEEEENAKRDLHFGVEMTLEQAQELLAHIDDQAEDIARLRKLLKEHGIAVPVEAA